MAFRFDVPCLLVASLFTLCHILTLIVFMHHRRGGNHFDLEAWKSFDANYIQEQEAYRRKVWVLEVCLGLLNALGWILFTIPLVQTAWLLSDGGQRKLSANIAIAVFAMGGSFAEIIARVMIVGARSAIHWLTSGFFNLDDWAQTGDFMGWRTVEVVNLAVNGLAVWVDSLEWLFLSTILFLIFLCVASKQDSLWSMRWAILGVVIGVLSFLDFSFSILRFKSWRTFSTLAFAVTCITRLVLMPIWLVWLSRILYTVQEAGKNLSTATRPVSPTERETEMT